MLCVLFLSFLWVSLYLDFFEYASLCFAPGRFAFSSNAETGIAYRLGHSSQHPGSFPESVNLWFQLSTFWGGGLPHTSGQISVVTFKFLPGLNAFSVFAVDQSLPHLLVWGRPRGNGSGNLPNSINLKKNAWRQKRCVSCASSRFPHSSGRPLRAYVFAGNAGYLMFLVNPSSAYIFLLEIVAVGAS